jgi:hypothetical protein
MKSLYCALNKIVSYIPGYEDLVKRSKRFGGAKLVVPGRALKDYDCEEVTASPFFREVYSDLRMEPYLVWGLYNIYVRQIIEYLKYYSEVPREGGQFGNKKLELDGDGNLIITPRNTKLYIDKNGKVNAFVEDGEPLKLSKSELDELEKFYVKWLEGETKRLSRWKC